MDETARTAVITVASKLRITPEALLSDLVDEALRARAAEMITHMRHLDGSQIDQLFAILKTIEPSEAEEAQDEPRRRRASGE